MSWELLVYLLKVNLTVVLCYAIYGVFLKGSVNHQWNRWYLILAPFLALILPLVSVKNEFKGVFTAQLPEVHLSQEVIDLSINNTNWIWVVTAFWLAGLLVALYKSSSQLVSVFKESKAYDGECSFTFFKSIRINQNLPEDIKRKVLIHEQVHADQWHTVDLIWIELYRVLFWFNPVFSWTQRSLKEIHEYIADAETHKATEEYPETLVAFAFGLNTLPLANQFQSINIKNRIKMIHKTNSSKHKAGLVFSLALAAVAIISISWTTISNNTNNGDQKVYEKVDTMPRFSGCEDIPHDEKASKCSNEQLMKYMISSINYPKQAEASDIEGKVFVEFTVDATGEVKNAVVKKGVHELLDAEALRVVNAMPKWSAGIHEGKVVSVSMMLPIKFSLD